MTEESSLLPKTWLDVHSVKAVGLLSADVKGFSSSDICHLSHKFESCILAEIISKGSEADSGAATESGIETSPVVVVASPQSPILTRQFTDIGNRSSFDNNEFSK